MPNTEARWAAAHCCRYVGQGKHPQGGVDKWPEPGLWRTRMSLSAMSGLDVWNLSCKQSLALKALRQKKSMITRGCVCLCNGSLEDRWQRSETGGRESTSVHRWVYLSGLAGFVKEGLNKTQWGWRRSGLATHRRIYRIEKLRKVKAKKREVSLGGFPGFRFE